MRILADENVPRSVVIELERRGHDVVWIRTSPPGVADPVVLARAQAEDRIVVTFDKDFGELTFRDRLSAAAGVILLRLLLPPDELASMVADVLDGRDDWSGHFSVIEAERVRMIALGKAGR